MALPTRHWYVRVSFLLLSSGPHCHVVAQVMVYDRSTRTLRRQFAVCATAMGIAAHKSIDAGANWTHIGLRETLQIFWTLSRSCDASWRLAMLQRSVSTQIAYTR